MHTGDILHTNDILHTGGILHTHLHTEAMRFAYRVKSLSVGRPRCAVGSSSGQKVRCCKVMDLGWMQGYGPNGKWGSLGALCKQGYGPVDLAGIWTPGLTG